MDKKERVEKMNKNRRGSKTFVLLFIISILVAVRSSSMDTQQIIDIQESGSRSSPPERVETQLLDEMYRIDITRITAIFDYYPDQYYVDCHALVEFRMRAGQQRPVIHLDPVIRNNTVSFLRLNNEFLNFSNNSDVRILTYADSSQQGIEFQRDLAAGIIHFLEISYRKSLPVGYPRFSSEVNDIGGRGNEELFPTLNTPHELARHVLTFRVHSTNPFRCIGSGLVVRDDANVQQWTLDTEREMASYTVMFVILPEEDTILEERNLGGINVRVLAFIGGAPIDPAFDLLQTWLPELVANLGPFPMPHGLSIFLVSSSGGMEYYGGTITSLWALDHEVFHMYFACSTVNSTYRDSWLDEAINMWYENSVDLSYTPISNGYRSNIVSGRAAAAVGFDRRAYNQGSRIIEAVARELGGRTAMIAFLRHIHSLYSFAPFTTQEFLDYLENYSGVDMRARFSNWLYSDNDTNAKSDRTFRILKHKVDMTPPDPLLKKYDIPKVRIK